MNRVGSMGRMHGQNESAVHEQRAGMRPRTQTKCPSGRARRRRGARQTGEGDARAAGGAQRMTQLLQQPAALRSSSCCICAGPEPAPGRPELCSCQRVRGQLGARSTDAVVFANLADEVGERLVDVDALLGARLDEATSKVLGEVASLCRSVSVVRASERPGPSEPARREAGSSRSSPQHTHRGCPLDARTRDRTCSRQQRPGRGPCP